MAASRAQQIGGAAERGQRAGRRAAEAQRRAAEAHERAHELAQREEQRTLEALRLSASRQAGYTQTAVLHAAEGHDRAARLFDDAACWDEERGDRAAAAAHRDRAERSRSEALADRAQRP